jgi:hypothetical protein
MTVYRLTRMAVNQMDNSELIDTYSNMLKVWKYINDLDKTLISYSRFAAIMKGQMEKVFGTSCGMFKVERIKIK